MKIILLCLVTFLMPVNTSFAGINEAFEAIKNKDYATAYIEHLKQAKRGDPVSQHNLGFLLGYGYGIEKNIDKAIYWFEKSYKQGHSQSLESLVYAYQTKCTEHSPNGELRVDLMGKECLDKIMKYTKEYAIITKDPDSQCIVGTIYISDTYKLTDYKEGLEWLNKSAKQGNLCAYIKLVVVYALGTGVEKNPQEALRWITKAAEQGDATAQATLGVRLLRGKVMDMVIEKKPKEGIEWIRKAAEQGFPDAQLSAGWAYYMGEGVEKDLDKAFEWSIKAAAQGQPHAQVNAATMLIRGEGTEKNYNLAVSYMSKGRDGLKKTNKEELNNLANNFYTGNGEPHDIVLAYIWAHITNKDDLLTTIKSNISNPDREKAETVLDIWKEKFNEK